LWLAQKIGVGRRPLTLAKAICAKLVMHLMNDERSKKAVDVAERFGLGDATKKELDAAYSDASAAYVAYAFAYVTDFDTFDASIVYAAYAAYAASAYDVAKNAADAYATYAAYSDPVDSTNNTAYAAYKRRKEFLLLKCAEICHEILTRHIKF